MARPKRDRSLKTVRIDEAAHSRLSALRSEVAREGMPPSVEDIDMLSALVLYTSPQQLAGMLASYWRSTTKLQDAADRQA